MLHYSPRISIKYYVPMRNYDPHLPARIYTGSNEIESTSSLVLTEQINSLLWHESPLARYAQHVVWGIELLRFRRVIENKQAARVNMTERSVTMKMRIQGLPRRSWGPSGLDGQALMIASTGRTRRVGIRAWLHQSVRMRRTLRSTRASSWDNCRPRSINDPSRTG